MAKKKSSVTSDASIEEAPGETLDDAATEAAQAIEGDLDQSTELDAEIGEELSPSEEFEAAHEEYVVVEEEPGRSFASRVLTWLVLLLLGAGAALWGAPRIAPHLPQFAAPIKPYLLPGATQAESQIDQLRTDLTGELEDVRGTAQSAADAAADTSAITEQMRSMEGDFDTRITTLGDQLAATDGAVVEGRLAALETKVDGLSAQLDQILSQVAGVDGEGISEEALANLASNAAAIDGISAEISSLSTKQGALSQRIDEVEAASERKLAQAQAEALEIEREAKASAAYDALTLAIDNGKSFAAPLAAYGENTGMSIPEPLMKAAPQGVATVEQLSSDYSVLAHQAIRASERDSVAEGGGTMDRIGSFLRSQVATRSLEATEGDGADAVLSRIGAAVNGEDLATALAEAENLPASAKAPLQGWLDQVKTRLDVTQAVAALSVDGS